MGRRPGTSTVLVLGALVLLVAIVVGNRMGNRVLGQIATRGADGVATPIPHASTPPPDAASSRVLWKRRQVLSVATDPAFPDPRITPEPEIPATPRPRPQTPKPVEKRTPRATSVPSDGAAPETTPDTTSTSVPLPLPIVSHSPDDIITPSSVQTSSSRTAPRSTAPTPSRNFPTLPPVSQPG